MANSTPQPAPVPGSVALEASATGAPIPSASSLSAPTEVASIAPAGDQMLRVSAADVELLLPVEYLVEILTIPSGQVVPIFHLPPWVPGVYNWRGEILWTADLSHLLGLPPWYQQANYGANHTVVVLDYPESRQLRNEERSPLGLIVNSVKDMTPIDLSVLSASPSHKSSAIDQPGQFVQGYWSQPGVDLPVLNGRAILDAMPQPNE